MDVSRIVAVYVGWDVLVRIEAGCGEDVTDGVRVFEGVTVGKEVGVSTAVEVGRGVLVHVALGCGEDVTDGM